MILSTLMGVLGLALAAVYLVTRLCHLSVLEHRADYVWLHAALGAGSAYVGWMLTSGAERPTLLHACMLAAAACHVLLGRERGHAWEPRWFARHGYQPTASRMPVK